MEEVTKYVAQKFTELKQAWAMQQLQSSQGFINKSRKNSDIMSVPEIINDIEPYIWILVEYIIIKYFKSSFWVRTRYDLFDLCEQDYAPKTLNSAFFSNSLLGTYIVYFTCVI